MKKINMNLVISLSMCKLFVIKLKHMVIRFVEKLVSYSAMAYFI